MNFWDLRAENQISYPENAVRVFSINPVGGALALLSTEGTSIDLSGIRTQQTPDIITPLLLSEEAGSGYRFSPSRSSLMHRTPSMTTGKFLMLSIHADPDPTFSGQSHPHGPSLRLSGSSDPAPASYSHTCIRTPPTYLYPS